MEPTNNKGKRDQLVIRAKGTNLLSEQKGPFGYKNKVYKLAIRAEGANWL